VTILLLLFIPAAICTAGPVPGSVDPTFDPGAGPVRLRPGSGERLLIQPDGKLLISGTFNGLGVTSAPWIVRLHPDDAWDRSFDASAIATSVNPFGSQGYFALLALQPNGPVLIAPASNNGSYGSRALLRLTGDGSLDESFRPQFTATSGVPRVNRAAVLADGRILVSGSFRTINGVERPRGGDRAGSRRVRIDLRSSSPA
jgi:hypothetical protein